MPTIVAESFSTFRWVHRGSGFSTGPTHTIEHNVIPARAFLGIHTALNNIQASTQGPLGAAIGIMAVDGMNFGPNPGDWAGVAHCTTGKWTTAMQVTKGEMNVWEVVQVWI